MGKRGLFCCETAYQLLNAIVLKQKLFSELPADIFLTEHTDFSAVINPLRETGLFDNVLQVKCRSYQDMFWEMPLEERKRVFKNPQLLLGEFPTNETYTDMFVPIDHIYWKLLYYHLLNRDIEPEIHFFEEGLRAYTMDICAAEQREAYNDNYYGKKSFANKITDYYLYESQLFSVENVPYNISAIPKLNRQDDELRTIVGNVYQVDPLPEERFIFFEESYIGDRKLANDFQLFQNVADITGKENIIVKRHPRNKIDRFSMHGYKVMDNWRCPWEAQLLLYDVVGKIFVTISSTASVTPFLLFDEPVHSVHLINMFVGNSPLLMDKAFKTCYDKMIALFNEREIMIHRPDSLEELNEILRYLDAYEQLKER